MFGRVRKYTIYIGTNCQGDKDDKDVKGVLKHVCDTLVASHTPFSIDVVSGGYVYNNMDFVRENSIVLILLGAKRKFVKQLARTFCEEFDQECVMVTSECVGMRMYK